MLSSSVEALRQQEWSLKIAKEGELMMNDRPNIDRMMDALSVILSNKYGCKVTLKAIPKDNAAEQAEKKAG